MDIHHKTLFSGKWQSMTLPEQMANIGSEVYRATDKFKKNKIELYQKAFERALELIDFTLSDERWKGRKKEISRVREIFCALFYGESNSEILDKEMEELNNYFTQFGIFVNSKKNAK